MVFLGGGSVFSSFYKQRLSPVGGGNEICESNPSCAAGMRAVVHSGNVSGYFAFHWTSKEMQKACFLTGLELKKHQVFLHHVDFW